MVHEEYDFAELRDQVYDFEFRVSHDKQRLLGSVYGETELPAAVSEITVHGERGTDPGFQPLLNILRRSEATECSFDWWN